MAFRSGQKVVCVDAEGTNVWGLQEIIKGSVYTISEVYVDEGTLCVELVEPTPFDRPRSCPFRASRFRPIVQQLTDISVFTAMLNDTKPKVDA